MVKNKLKIIMDSRHIGIREMARATGLAINTVSGLYHDTSKRVDLETLDKLCTFLGVAVGEILEHVEEPPQE